MKNLLVLLALAFCIVVTAQKKKKAQENAIIPQTQKDSLKLESLLIEAEKEVILENYANALEKFKVAQSLNNISAVIPHKIAVVMSKMDQGINAVPFALQAIELAPANPFYVLQLAKLYKSIGFYIDAAKQFERYIQTNPTDEYALYNLVELYQTMGRQQDLFRIFDWIEQRLGVKEKIVRERQRIYLSQGNIDMVVKEYRKLINSGQRDIAVQMELIDFLIRNNRLDEAEQELQLLQQTNSTSRINLLKSELLWMRGNREEALKLLRDVLKAKTIDFKLKFQLLSNYVISAKTKDMSELASTAKQLADQYPKEFEALGFAGDLLYQAKMEDEALKYYLKAIEVNSTHFSVWQNVLNIVATKQDYEAMIKYAEQAMEYFPNQALLYYFAGTGYLANKNYKKAIPVLERSRKLTTDRHLLTYIYGQLGDAYNGLEENQKSFEAYEKALMNDPNNDHVLNNYSYFLSLDKLNMKKALNMSTKLVKQHPENPTYLDTHGWVLYTIENYKEAKKYLEKAASLGDDGVIIEHYGDVLYRLGEINKAIAQWKKAKKVGGASHLLEQKIVDKKLYE